MHARIELLDCFILAVAMFYLNQAGVFVDRFTVVTCGQVTKKSSFSKIRVAYNNFYRKLLHVTGRSSASAMFVENNIPNFECLIRRDIYSFTTRLKTSSNTLIS